jgi:hypothetical protein
MVRKKKNVATVVETVVAKPNSEAKKERRRRARQRRAARLQIAERGVASVSHIPVSQRVVSKENQLLKREIRAMKKGENGFEQLTPGGRAWLEKALNPCDYSVPAVGFPDLSAANVALFQEREQFDLQFGLTPVGATGLGFTGTPDEAELWNTCLISDPYSMMTYTLIWQGALGAPSYAAWFANQDRIRPHLAEAGFVEARINSYGTTVEFTGPTIQDQGELIAGQLAANWQPMKDDSDSDNLLTWQLNGDPTQEPSGNQLFEFVRQLMDTDPQAVATKAKLGAYFAHKRTEPVNSYSKIDGILAEEKKKFFYNPFASAYATVAVPDPLVDTDPRITQMIGDPGYSWNAAIFIARGLSTQSSFQVKKYVSMEAHLTPSSPIRYYTRLPVDEDELAQEMYKHISRTRPSAYPSSYNAFGFLKKAFNWAKGAVKWVGNKIVKPFRPLIEKIPGADVALGVTDALGVTQPAGYAAVM